VPRGTGSSQKKSCMKRIWQQRNEGLYLHGCVSGCLQLRKINRSVETFVLSLGSRAGLFLWVRAVAWLGFPAPLKISNVLKSTVVTYCLGRSEEKQGDSYEMVTHNHHELQIKLPGFTRHKAARQRHFCC